MTRSAGLARLLLGTVTLVVVTLGATARQRLQLTRTRADLHVVLVNVWSVIAVPGAVLGLLILFARLVGVRRARTSSLPTKRMPWRTYLVVGLLIGVAIHFRDVIARGFTRLRAPTLLGPDGGRATDVNPAVPHNGSATTATIVAVALLVCLSLAVLLTRRKSAPAAPVIEPDAADEAWTLAVYDGSIALADIADPRAAIIACYSAMRAALIEAGVTQIASDTPADMLSRVAAAGVAPDAARDLTALFLEARFSRHLMTEAQRAQALAALGALAAATPPTAVGGVAR